MYRSKHTHGKPLIVTFHGAIFKYIGLLQKNDYIHEWLMLWDFGSLQTGILKKHICTRL